MTNSAPKPINESTLTPDRPEDNVEEAIEVTPAKDSYVKLAMRNMVRKGRQSLWHFFLTTLGLVGLLVGLAYLNQTINQTMYEHNYPTTKKCDYLRRECL